MILVMGLLTIATRVLGIEVEDIERANAEALQMIDLENLDFENATIEKGGNIDYLTITKEVEIDEGGADKNGYMKLSIDSKVFDEHMLDIEEEYESLPIFEILPRKPYEILPEFVKQILDDALKFLPSYMIPEFYGDIRENIQRAREEHYELKNTVKSLKIVKSPVKKDEVVVDVEFDSILFYLNDYEPHFLDYIQSTNPHDKLNSKIMVMIGGMVHMTKCFKNNQFMLPVMSNHLAAYLINQGNRILLQDKDYISLAEKFLLNDYGMSVIGIKDGVIDVLLEVPLRHKKNAKDTKVM